MEGSEIRKCCGSLMSPPEQKCKGPKELCLDTKGYCFLCLKEIDTCTISDSSGITAELCLRNICRYLGIDPVLVLLKGLQGSVLNDEKDTLSSNDKQCDFTVKLCSHCCLVGGKLSSLIHQLEDLKLLLSYQLHLFHKILKESDHKSEGGVYLWSKFQEKTNLGNNDAVEAHLVQQLRQETIDKSSTKVEKFVKHSFPRVKLIDVMQPVRVPPTTAYELQLASNPSLDRTSPPPLYPYWIDDEEKNKNTLENFTANSANSFCNISNLSEDTDSSYKITLNICNSNIKKINSKGYYSYGCLVCRKLFACIFRMRQHVVNVHPEQFFNKLPQSSHKKFSSYCKTILYTEIRQFSRREGGQNRKIICRICNKTCSDSSVLRMHYMLKHYSVLEEKLINLLQIIMSSNSPAQSLQVSSRQLDLRICGSHCTRIKVNGKVRHECPFCSKDFLDSTRARLHLINTHSETLFYDTKLPVLSNKQFKKYCDEVLLTQTQKYRATLNGRKVFCRICKKRPINSHAFRYHMVMEHYPVLQEKLIDLQKRSDNQSQKISREDLILKTPKRVHSNVVCNFCERKFSNKYGLWRHKREACPGFKHHTASVWECSVSDGGCGRKLSSRYVLTRHIRRNCSRRKNKHALSENVFFNVNAWKRRTCLKCNKRFLSEELLMEHKKISHYCQVHDGSNSLGEEGVSSDHYKSSSVPKISQNYNTNSTNNIAKLMLSPSKFDIESEKKSGLEDWDKETYESVTCFCGKPFHGRRMIECENCLVWYHFSCVGINDNIPHNFKCSTCIINNV